MRKNIVATAFWGLLLPCACIAYPKDFSGPFAAGMLGGSFATVGAQAFTSGGASFPTGTSNNSGGGVSGGLMGGYLHKVSDSFPLHVGILGGTTVSSASGSETTKSSSGGASLSAKHKFKRPHAFQAGVMLGYPVSNTIMPFGILGWENAMWKHTVTTTSPSNTRAKSSGRQNALLAGAGVAKKVTANASVGLMYQGSFHLGSKQTSKGGGTSATHKGAQHHGFMTFLMYTFK